MMTSFTARSKCLYTLSLLYRWKWIRYIFLTTILFLIVIGVSITELRHARYVNFIKQDNAKQLDGVIYTEEKDIDNSDYRVDVRVHENKEGFPFEESILNRVGGDGQVNGQRFIDVEAFAAGEEEARKFIDAASPPRNKKSNIAGNRISFNLKYINSNFIDRERKEAAIKTINDYLAQEQEKLKDVRRSFDHANDGDITSRGQPNSFITSHLRPNDAIAKGVYNVSGFINYVSNNGIQRKLNTVDSENQIKRNQRGSADSTPSHDTRSRANELDSTSTTEKPVYNSFPPTQNSQTTTKSKTTAKKCTPVDNVIFLKTHKTGSSTIINIMQRYAHTHNLKVALPNISHFLGWPNTFRQRYVFEHSPGMKYNILCNHARFHRERMLNLMESKNTKIVTIIRDPLYQFESTAVYLNFFALFKIDRKKNLLDAFFNKSKMEIYNRTKKRNTHNIFLVKNPITYDLGYPTWKEDNKLVEKILQKVKSDFHLVMISDYMAESLVMLKEELCWDMKDIVYFTMNKRPDKLRQQIKDRTKTRLNVQNWNSIDYRIFEHYNKTFWERVRRGGSEFQEQVDKLKGTNDWLRQMCLQPGRHFDKSQPWFPILGFKLKNESKNFKFRTLCENMIRSEIDYTNLLKLKQTRFNWTVPTSPPKKKKVNPSKSNNKTNQRVQTVISNKVNDNLTNDGKKIKNPDTG